MWKIAVGFIIFSAISLYVIMKGGVMKGGDSIDMSGEKHGVEPAHAPASAAKP